MKLIYKKLRNNAVVPFGATAMSGGLDLTAAHIEQKSPNEVTIYTGLALQPTSSKYMIRIAPRSSFTKYNWILQNSPALGDADYTGEYMLKFRAIPTGIEGFAQGVKLTYDEFPYKVGDRCAQMWIEEIIEAEFEEGELKDTERGEGGFGSTNK